ncbi:MAG: MBL fold metallo-hydrolase [Desulfobacteraceae bacterium]|nr:MBL fold metallo-hydrolase [Desulfobacteraceae bacterium]MBC2755732.1 MBL fold metallo-hydrolase [Desulfobacteraceae bacterium]
MEERHFGPVWFIPGHNSGKYPYCHSLYIEGPGILIDPSSDRDRLKQLKQNQGVRSVWLSHWHEDHFMHLDLFDDVPLWMSAADAQPLSSIDNFLDAYGIEEDFRELSKVFFKEQFRFRPRKPDRFLKNGEVIKFDSLSIEVIHTPGHTPGHLTFFFKESEVLYMGDYDLSSFGPWYGDVYSDIEEIRKSVTRLQSIPAKIWLTAHEKGIFEDFPDDIWHNYLDVIDKREQKLLDFLENPRSIDEIAHAWIVYGKPREPESFYLFGEKGIMQKHLARLAVGGKIGLKNDKYFKL